MIAHLLHDVDLTIGRPGTEVHRHHPESGPCALALRQFDAGLDIAVGPTALHLRIDTTGVDLAILLEAVDLEFAIHDIRDVTTLWSLMVYVVLQLVVHPVVFLYLMCPVGRVQFSTFVELVLPH